MSSLDLSYANSIEDLPDLRVAYSPSDMFVESIRLHDGASVTAGELVAVMDSTDLQLEIDKYNTRMEIVKLAEARLSSDYLEKFTYPPLRAALEFCQENENSLGNILRAINDRFRLGELTRREVGEAETDLAEAIAKRVKSEDELSQKKIKIKEETARKDAEKDEILSKIRLTQRQISLCQISSPASGKLQLLSAAGVFVEKGDPLFRVAE